MKIDKELKLLNYLQKIGGVATIEKLVALGGEIGEEASTPNWSSRAAGVEAALEATSKLNRGAALSSNELFNLEAIILPELRPAIRIVGGSYSVSHSSWVHLNKAAPKGVITAALQSVGRIELPGHPTLPYGGTGFVVGDELLMTNRHVAEIFTSGLGLSALKFRPGHHAGIDFKKESEDDPDELLRVADVVLIHPYWDMALLRVSGLRRASAPLKLSVAHPDDLRRKEVAVIGYPAFDPRNSASVQDRVFGGVYNVKRLQPGTVQDSQTVTSFDHNVLAMTHDSSTLGGNSGSAVIDIANGHVVGLHFGGRYLEANYSVPSHALNLDSRVIDAGVWFAHTPSPGANAGDRAWEELEMQERAVRPDPATPRMTFDLPIRITIEAGAPAMVAPHKAAGDSALAKWPAPAAAPSTEAIVEPVRDRDYGTRKGYDAKFLGVEIPMPQPADNADAVRFPDGGVEIAYHHFSVIMHRRRRLAWVTAANVDANPARKRPELRPDHDYTRDGLGGMGDNDQERWFTDPRIASNEQLPDLFFSKDRKAFDKGHLVRREDVAWGGTYDEVRFANGDTFHVTNCSPQVAGFNRAAARNWGALENVVLRAAAAERLNVFAAPVLSDNDREFRGVDESGTVRVPIPSRFWKVIVAVADDKVQTFGFMLDQDLSAVEWEFAVEPVWRAKMRTIAEIEAAANIVFPQMVRDGDQAGTAHGEAVSRDAGLAAAAGGSASPSDPANAAAADVPIDLALDDLSPILDGWLRQQEQGGVKDDVRMTLNFEGDAPDDATTAAALSSALRLTLDVQALFDETPELQNHRLLRIPGVSRIDRPDLFDLARVVRRISGASTVDPDLGTDFFDGDRPATRSVGPESGGLTFWCWADDDDSPADKDWAIKTTKVPEAWALSQTKGKAAEGKGVRVFQPDTGVIAKHSELGAGLHEAAGAANFVELGQPGALDPLAGGSNPGHGTGTGSVVVSPKAGIMRGVAPQAALTPIRCVRSVAVFDQSPVAQAINHARLKGAHVITMSLGGISSAALRAAVQAAVKSNIIVLAAAGNCVGEVVWPARYPEVIALGGVNAAGKPWRGSCSGPSIAVSGPAEFVLRADARNLAGPNAASGGQGTSFATAHMAGVAALWLAHHGRDELIAKLPPGRTLQEMFRAVVRLSAKVPSGFDTANYGAGIVDAEGALKREPLAALNAVAPERGSGVLDQLTGLLDRVFGAGSSEAAAPALGDSQNYPELATAAFERLRASRTRLASREAMPPTGLSAGLREALGHGTERFARAPLPERA
ncbi:DNA/RNA non-specific endonuclease [Hansschlegelia quercus]|uniref:Serine protease n=1 Tax=Hansschlegelia quercus TaxID=2528245 RepID=A0A4V2JEA3_9HYPH|nr:DNA/RNA non-specific endonuclease [Hansschlegelia quercus]TBN54456.1 hypothetical protein EYR15_06395 [Hansschlegelia quercus]